MVKIVDPDDLTLTLTDSGLGTTADIYYNTSTFKIKMTPGLAIDAVDGISEQCAFSFTKEAWLARIKFLFDTGTTSGPSSGDLRLNNAAPASVTNIFVNETNASGKSATALLGQITNGSKIRVFKQSDPTVYAEYTAGTVTDNGTDRTIPVTYVAHNGTFSNNDPLYLSVPSPFAALKFPFEAISAAAGIFELRNGWDWNDSTTRNVIKDGGWTLYSSDNSTVLERWMNVKSLGSIDNPASDQPYFWQVDSSTATVTDTINPGPVNQAVKIFGGPSNGNFDYRNFFAIALREQGKTYDYYDLLTEQAITQLQAQSYSFPLSNSTDLKITAADTDIDANSDDTADVAPYSGMSITYLAGTGFTAWTNATVYSANAVVSSAGRWYITTAGGTSSGTGVADDSGVTWVAYTGERELENTGSYYPYNVIVDANNGTTVDAYEFIQWQLRRTGDIDAGAGTRDGLVADELASFVGDRLVTTLGVYVDDWTPTDVNNITNEITYTDANGNSRTPTNPDFVSQGVISFNDNLQNDDDAYYWMYFTSGFGTTSAIIVNDNSGNPIQGFVGGEASKAFDFDYDNNSQGGRTPSTNAAVTVVAIGTDTAQYVVGTGTITRSTTNPISLTAGTERNYVNA
jgi:hypothetical protein